METSSSPAGSLPVVPVCYSRLMTDFKKTQLDSMKERKPVLKISDCLAQHSGEVVYRPIVHGEQDLSGKTLSSLAH